MREFLQFALQYELAWLFNVSIHAVDITLLSIESFALNSGTYYNATSIAINTKIKKLKTFSCSFKIIKTIYLLLHVDNSIIYIYFFSKVFLLVRIKTFFINLNKNTK